ncbi:hypothetical protein GWK47_006366 [Chionoecetes opilio]|uniref:Uncharacterized protein n=1 Tax=Chionoecetes opilio TaxID=41210 RepID=A0A8J4YCY3_CHIOP|nr:hypothetical protein GWK47_006366 [Chionoecetes opilio]
MTRFFGTAVLMVTLSLTVTSQPFPQQDPSKHSDFIWNSKNIGNKKVATLTIRKDEERDRRSISPVAGDGNVHINVQRRHHHRHHHGKGARAAMWLVNDRSVAEHNGGGEPPEGYASEQIRYKNILQPVYVAEPELEARNRVKDNDVHPESALGEDHMPSFPEILEEAGITLKPSLLKSKTTNKRRGNSEESRKRKGTKSKRNKKARRNRNNKMKKKKQRSCRRLRGESRRKCLNALRQCRSLKKRKKKNCRAAALQAALNEASGIRKESDIFSFLKNMTRMSGKEACHYNYLKECCTQVGFFAEGSNSNMPVVKCHFRKEFLKCMQNMQQGGTCNQAFHTLGDMTTLRKKIKEIMWTPSSCLISDVVEG